MSELNTARHHKMLADTTHNIVTNSCRFFFSVTNHTLKWLRPIIGFRMSKQMTQQQEENVFFFYDSQNKSKRKRLNVMVFRQMCHESIRIDSSMSSRITKSKDERKKKKQK